MALLPGVPCLGTTTGLLESGKTIQKPKVTSSYFFLNPTLSILFHFSNPKNVRLHSSAEGRYDWNTTDFVDFSAWCFRKVSSKASPALRVWKHRSSGRSGDEVTKLIRRSESQTLLVAESPAHCRKPSGFLMVFGSHPFMVGTRGVPWSPRFFGQTSDCLHHWGYAKVSSWVPVRIVEETPQDLEFRMFSWFPA